MTRPVPRIALTREEAARAIGMSLTSFEIHVQPEIRLIRRGKLRLVPVRELTRWADTPSSRLPGGTVRRRVNATPSMGRRRVNAPAPAPKG
jgi:hypothetical protein